MAQTQPKTAATERDFQLLVKPLVTEKTTMVSEAGNWITFEVAIDATKPQIKRAFERIYNVNVERVNTQIRKGKNKRFRGIAGRQSDRKIAFVRLKDGQSIDVAAGA